MLGTNCFRKIITSFTAVAVFCVSSMVTLAAAKDVTGEITVTGQVTVNGQPAVSNSSIISGSTIVTGSDSSAIISLGKTGRIEVMADSNLVLNFSDSSITGVLSAGKARVSNAAGVTTSIATKDMTAIADTAQASTFTVEVECSHSHVDTAAGSVTMREGSSDRQVAAGSNATAGSLEQTGCKPCLRPNSAPPVRVGGWWLLLAAAGVAGAAIYFTTRKDDDPIGGGPVIVSPVS